MKISGVPACVPDVEVTSISDSWFIYLFSFLPDHF